MVTAIALAVGYTYPAKAARAYVTCAAGPKNKKQVFDPNTRVPDDVIVVAERSLWF